MRRSAVLCLPLLLEFPFLAIDANNSLPPSRWHIFYRHLWLTDSFVSTCLPIYPNPGARNSVSGLQKFDLRMRQVFYYCATTTGLHLNYYKKRLFPG
jgi:hypothetical protein